MKTSPTRSKGAFALAETLVVLAMIAIVAALLAPSLMTWQSSVAQDRLRATASLLSQACSRAGLAGAAVPESSRGTLGDIVTWYQANGYIQPGLVDVSKLSLSDFGDIGFTDCTNGNPNAPVFAGDASSLTPGPTAALWWNTRYIQLSLPATPTGAQTLDLEGSTDGVNWTVVASNVTDTFTDGPFDPNTTRYYRVVAVSNSGRTPGPTTTATTAPPLAAPNSLSVVLGTVTGTSTNPPPPAPLTYTLPAVPNQGNSGPSAGLDLGGWQWLLSGTGNSPYPAGGAVTSTPLSPPGAITFSNVTSTNYTLTLPTLPHDLVDENGRIYDFAYNWILCSSTDGKNWTYPANCEWRSTLGPPATKTGFGWTCQGTGDWVENPSPMVFDATPGTTYYYQLVGSDTAGLHVYGKVISITTPGAVAESPVSPNAPAAPGQVSVSNLSQTSVNLTMPTLPDRATSLMLEASTDGGNSWVTVATGLGENEVVPQTGLTSATYYAYCVCAVNAFGSTQGTPKSVVTLGGLPSVPGAVVIGDVTTSSYTFTLPQLPNAATSFTLQTSYNGLTWTTISSGLGSGAVVAETGLAPNSSTPYLLLAVNQYGYAPGSPFFATTGGIPAAPSTPAVANLGATSFNLRLPALPTGAASFTLETSADGSAWQDGETGLAGLAVVSEAAQPGSTYNFRLKSVNAWGETPGSSFTVTTPQTPAAPGNVTLNSLTDTGFRLLMPSLPSGADTLKLETTSDNGLTWQPEAGHDPLAGGATVIESGLTPNTTYSYRVQAVNQWGETPGTGFSVTTAGPPAAPGEIAVSGVTTSSFAFTLPGLPSGATSLTLEVLSGGNWITDGTNANVAGNAVIQESGKTAGTTYQYQLLANNAWGSTAGLSFAVMTNVAAPSAPENPMGLSQTPTSFTLGMPALPTGATSLSVQLSTDGSAWTTGADSLAAGATTTISGLTPEAKYYCRALAVNSGGSTPGNTFAVTMPPLPTAPGVIAASNVGSNSLTLTMPGLPPGATSLTLEASLDGSTWATGKVWTSGSTWVTGTGLTHGSTAPQGGLTAGTTYYYRAVAVNSYSAMSGSSIAVTTASLPSAPDVATVSSLATTSFALTMPALPANTTYLTLQTSADAGATWTDANPGLAAGASVSKIGLTNGATYYYRLLAVNSFGSTAGPQFTVTTLALPGTPGVATSSAVTATSFTLTMPALPANAATLTLRTSTDGGFNWTDANTGLAGGATVSKTGLTAGTTYYYHLVAVNANGSTAGSQFTVTTASLPGVPGVATSSALTPTSFTLTMPSKPANTTSLTLQTSSDSGATWTDANTGLSSGQPVSKTGLTAGTTYYYRVLAVNAYGSTAGTQFTVTTSALPSTPGVAAVSGITMSSFNLTMPSLPANTDSLTLQNSTDGGTTWNTQNTGLAGGAGVAKSGLTAGTAYTYRLLAVNTGGATAGATFTATTGALPGVPDVGWTNYTSSTSLTLTMPPWLPSNATSFTVQNSPDGGTTWNTQNTGLAASAVASKTGLTSGATYTYRLLAVNTYGSTAGATFTAVAGAPTMPGNFAGSGITVSPTSSTSFNLIMPSLTSGATSLTLQTSTDGGSTWSNANTGLAGVATVSKTGLTNGATYYYRVLAVNAAGSTASSAIAVVAGGPATPASASASNITSSSFTLTMPAKPAGATSLTLQVMSGGTWVTDTTGLTSGSTVNKSGMASGTKYFYRVLAVNALGSINGTYMSVTTL